MILLLINIVIIVEMHVATEEKLQRTIQNGKLLHNWQWIINNDKEQVQRETSLLNITMEDMRLMTIITKDLTDDNNGRLCGHEVYGRLDCMTILINTDTINNVRNYIDNDNGPGVFNWWTNDNSSSNPFI